MITPLEKREGGWVFSVQSKVLVIGNGKETEIIIKYLSAHSVVWVGGSLDFLNSNLSIFPHSQVSEVKGQRGNFDVKISGPHKDIWIKVGGIVISSFLSLKNDNQLPLSPLIQPLFNSSKIETNKKKVAFYLAYGENEGFFSTEFTLKEALRFISLDFTVYIFYKNLKLASSNNYNLYENCKNTGVNFIYINEPLKIKDKSDFIQIEYKDPFVAQLGLIQITVDYIFYSEVYYPSSEYARLSDVLKIPLDSQGYFQNNNVHLFPNYTNRPGIYVIGSARGKLNDLEINLEAAAIAGELSALLSNEIILENRFAKIDQEKCVLCLNCFNICPTKAVEVDSLQQSVFINPLACQGCGMCTSDCPAKAIVLPFYEDELIDQKITNKIKGKTLIFACQNSGYIALRKTPLSRDWRTNLEVIPVPCAGKIDIIYILKALALGAEQVVLSICAHDNCKGLYGILHAESKVKQIKDKLESIGLNQNKVSILNISANAPFKLQDAITKLLNQMTKG